MPEIIHLLNNEMKTTGTCAVCKIRLVLKEGANTST